MTATDSPRPPRSTLLGVFLISACVLALEVALTRIFSAVLRYHFVFLVISVAVCGLGVGAMLTHGIARLRCLPLSTAATGFGLSALAFIVVLFKLILAHCPDTLLLIALLILVPFVFAGMFLAVAFRRHAESAGLLYAYDLCGAAAASIGIIVAMQWFGALNAYLATALLACAAGLVERRRSHSSQHVLSSASVVLVALALGSNLAVRWLDIPPIPTQREDYAKPLYAELADKSVGSRIIHSEWDAFARTDVVEDPQAGKDVRLIYTNGHVPTILLRYDAKTRRFAQQPVIAEVPFEWRRPERVLCIGPGAGLDLVIATKWGARKIDGVEVNPAIPRILRMKRFQEFGDDPYHLPGVNVTVGDGRTFVLRSREQYDFIFMALTKTATSSAGLSLVEGYIYTLEAFEDYWNRLSSNGQLVLVTDGLPVNIRLLNTALTMLMNRGLPLQEALDHIALISVTPQMRDRTPYEYALIVSKQPIRGREGDRLFRTTRRAGFQEVFIPGESEQRPFSDLRREGSSPTATLQSFSDTVSTMMQQNVPTAERHAINFTPVSDDSPFFLDLTYTIPFMLVPLFFVTLVPLLLFLLALAVQQALHGGDARAVGATLAAALYFSCLGVGFMMIEIPLVQKLILVLGHPTLALTVVLCALLLGGGIGSALSQRLSWQRLPLVCVSAALLAGAYAVYLRAPHVAILALPGPGRIAWAAALSGALGVVLGMPFPLGLRALARADDVPAMWGINGLTSVLGSLLAAVGAKMVGFQCVFFGGVVCYLLAALLRVALARTAQPTAPAE